MDSIIELLLFSTSHILMFDKTTYKFLKQSNSTWGQFAAFHPLQEDGCLFTLQVINCAMLVCTV